MPEVCDIATVLAGLWGPNKDESGAIRNELKASYYASSFSEAVRLITAAQRPRLRAAELMHPTAVIVLSSR